MGSAVLVPVPSNAQRCGICGDPVRRVRHAGRSLLVEWYPAVAGEWKIVRGDVVRPAEDALGQTWATHRCEDPARSADPWEQRRDLA